MPSQEKIDLNFLRIAIVNGYNMSKDPNRKVGAVLLSEDGRQVSLGYNGFPIGIEETEAKWTRSLKYEYVVHGEINAILNAPFDSKNATIYTTFKPCHRCMTQIVNARIRRAVYFRDPIPFIGNNEDVWNDCAKQLIVVEYDIDELTQGLINLYNFKHDGYKEMLNVVETN